MTDNPVSGPTGLPDQINDPQLQKVLEEYVDKLEQQWEKRLEEKISEIGKPPPPVDVNVQGFQVKTHDTSVDIIQGSSTITLTAAELPLFIRTMTRVQVILNSRVAETRMSEL